MSSRHHSAIPVVDIGPLFGPPSPARDAADRAIAEAGGTIGFVTVTGLPADIPTGRDMRRRLLRIFDLPETELRGLWRQKFDPAQPNVYRGWFPPQAQEPSYKDGIDLGPDLAYGATVVDDSDILCGATPLPPEAALPGWRAGAAEYYRAMERCAAVLMRSIARGLGLVETTFDEAFRRGISTLRLLRYPPRSADILAKLDAADIWTIQDGVRREVVARAHADSGFVTLLLQDGVPGLQARGSDGIWLDVPPQEGTLAVNFGKVLHRWTGGRMRATQHRVLSPGRLRYSIPFFYEPRPDAEIAPLPLDGVEPFEPFLFGDHLWASTTGFTEYRGMEHLRPPRRPTTAALAPRPDQY